MTFFLSNQMDSKKRLKTSEQHSIDAMESTLDSVLSQLLFVESAVRTLNDEHNRAISSANRQFSELLRRSKPSNNELMHQLELRCVRLERENEALRSAREKEASRISDLERTNAARERAWAGLDPAEVRLIVEHERRAFESAPDATVDRRLELRYNRDAMEKMRVACFDRVQQAEAHLPQMQSQLLAAEAKASHAERKWTALRDRVQGCEAEAARARIRMSTLTKEMLSVLARREAAEAGLAAARRRIAELEAQLGSQHAEIAALRADGAAAVVRRECAQRIERMEAEHRVELDALKAAAGERVNALKLRLNAAARRCKEFAGAQQGEK